MTYTYMITSPLSKHPRQNEYERASRAVYEFLKYLCVIRKFPVLELLEWVRTLALQEHGNG